MEPLTWDKHPADLGWVDLGTHIARSRHLALWRSLPEARSLLVFWETTVGEIEERGKGSDLGAQRRDHVCKCGSRDAGGKLSQNHVCRALRRVFPASGGELFPCSRLRGC